ncbi:hypothetical protein B0H14DRAFT_1345654 [Mycena olivaceomarginata]|nr:hypothetical protein B0H14DRAFT_1345654 [Mycena olivaceomarginata]
MLASATAPDHMSCTRSRERISSGNRPYTEPAFCLVHRDVDAFPMIFASVSPACSPLPHVSCTSPVQLDSLSAPKDMYTRIESLHPNTNLELANCRVPPPRSSRHPSADRRFIRASSKEALRLYDTCHGGEVCCTSPSRWLALYSMIICANSRGLKKRCIYALLRHARDPVGPLGLCMTSCCVAYR